MHATTDRHGGFRAFFALEPVSGELLHLDLLRFVASAGIVWCHSFQYYFAPALRDAANRRTEGLQLFVEAFFIISGFVIAWVYHDRMHGWRDFARFMQRRVGRLYPLHFATLLAMAALYWLVFRLGVNVATPPDLSPGCLLRAAALLHAVVPCAGPVPNVQSWSISAEMAAYCLFPLLLWLLVRSRYPVLCVAGVLALQAGLMANDADRWGTLPAVVRAMPTFAYGILLFKLRAEIARLPGARALAVLSTVAFAAGCMLELPLALLLAFIYVAVTATVAADMKGSAAPWVTRFAPLGQLTYSIYMLHVLVLTVLVSGLGDKLLRLSPLALSAVTVAAYGVIFVGSMISFKTFETPARRWIDSRELFARPAAR